MWVLVCMCVCVFTFTLLELTFLSYCFREPVEVTTCRCKTHFVNDSKKTKIRTQMQQLDLQLCSCHNPHHKSVIMLKISALSHPLNFSICCLQMWPMMRMTPLHRARLSGSCQRKTSSRRGGAGGEQRATSSGGRS